MKRRIVSYDVWFSDIRSLIAAQPDIHRYQQLNGWIGNATIRATMVRPEASHTVAQLLSIVLQLIGSLLSSIDVLFAGRSAAKAMTKNQGRGRATMGAKTKKPRIERLSVSWSMLTGLLAVVVASGLSIVLAIDDGNQRSWQIDTRVDVQSFTTVNYCSVIHCYQQLNGWIGNATIRATMVRPEASHTVAQLLTSHWG